MEEKMADIRDEHGNPIELTDELGNPVVLTDEHGNPMRLTGVATKIGPTLGSLMRSGGEDGPSGGHGDGKEEHDDGGSGGHVRSTTSGSSSFDEEDEQSKMRKKKDERYFSPFDEGNEQTERRKKKKKGLTQKIKEKLTGRRHKEEQPHTPLHQTTTATETASQTTVDRPIDHLKRGAVEKISDGSGYHTH